MHTVHTHTHLLAFLWLALVLVDDGYPRQVRGLILARHGCLRLGSGEPASEWATLDRCRSASFRPLFCASRAMGVIRVRGRGVAVCKQATKETTQLWYVATQQSYRQPDEDSEQRLERGRAAL